MAELVIATSPAVAYPGGVIAISCADFVGASRGTLSTESDALSATGTVIRDTQTVTTSILTDPEDAYDEADVTLTFSVADVGLQVDEFLDTYYLIYVSYRTEGTWEIDYDIPCNKISTDRFFRGCTAFGIGPWGFFSTPQVSQDYISRKRPHYIHGQFNALGAISSSETFEFKVFSQAGSSIEWLLDQFVLIPAYEGSGFLDSFIGSDFPMDTAWVDGADGGDDNGKFTQLSVVTQEPQGSDSRADFQRYADDGGDDAEYLFHYDGATDGAAFTLPGDPFVYSEHCLQYLDQRVISRDEFTRTEPDGELGISPEGFGYDQGVIFGGTVGNAYVDGSGVAKVKSDDPVGGQSVDWWPGGDITGTINSGADFNNFDSWSFSGKVRIATEVNADWRDAATPTALIRIAEYRSSEFDYRIEIDLEAMEWSFVFLDDATSDIRYGPIDISGWYSDGDWIGFRFEVKRFLIRCKVWDASGSEPGTWDTEEFRKHDPTSGSSAEYPYSDDEVRAMWYTQSSGMSIFTFIQSWGPDVDSPLEIHYDDFEYSYDPVGDPANGYARLESPASTVLDEIEIPYGAAYFVYWGVEPVTTLDSGFYVIVVSPKVWNDPAAAELQRHQLSQFHFFLLINQIAAIFWKPEHKQITRRRYPT